jgi:phosphonate metabolism-associated iron-containing alcohol dehydrogenase
MQAMGDFNWHMPVRLHFGAGCSDALPTALGQRSAVVLAFAPAIALGLRSRWQQALGGQLQGWVSVPEGLASIRQARALAADLWSQMDADTVLIAVGGGTTLDLAKLLRCRPREGQFEALAAALRGAAPWPAMQRAPLWLLPTTAGTGSEVTRWATVWDTDGDAACKRSLDQPWGHAERAFVDPALALSCPPEVTRDTALDALAHALEALWNRHANPLSSGLAVQAARGVIAHLPAVLDHPRDLALRTRLSLAALQAGLAFSQTRTALAHALSYDLTLQQGVPHGLACALWLPTAWHLALGCNAATDAALAEVFGVPAQAGLQHLQAWLEGLGINTTPAAFAELGIHDADQRVHAALASERGRNFIGTARPAACTT